MKRALLAILLVAAGLAGACRLSDMRTDVIRTPQVVNAACEQRVRDALARLKGIEMKTLAFDHEAGAMTVTYESLVIARKNIEHAIIAAGFDANELTADPAARAALPPECLPAPTPDAGS